MSATEVRGGRSEEEDRGTSPAADGAAGGSPGELSRGIVLLLAVACGAAVANLYYAQPLLHTIGRAFGVSNGTAGLLVTVSQAGYVLGLAFLVPLGDLLERRRLITTVLLGTAVLQGVAAAAPAYGVFAAALLLVGVTAVVAQIIVPMASMLAAPEARGRVVGTVMSGLLIGILLARTVSGLVAGAFGWRAIFAVAAVLMVLVAAALRRALPPVAPSTDLPYRGLLRSVLSLVRQEPVLRQRMVLGGLGFGCFSVLWTSLAFLLTGSGGGHYHLGTITIGLFGLAGAAGASIAPVAGRMADRGRGHHAVSAALAILVVSWGLLALGVSSVVALIAGIVALDLGVQALQISNQSAIYTLQPEARSRLTTGYMVAYFLGGTIMSAVTSSLYGSDGWGGICILGAAISVVALVFWLVSQRRLAAHDALPRSA